jgi:nucleotide-binding universal stress UspA family protein
VVKPAIPDTGDESFPQGDRNADVLKAKGYLGAIVDQLHEGLVAPAGAGLKLMITWSVAVNTDVASALIRLAENGEDAEGGGVFGGCDIIVMATHGYGGFQRWVMGSITERVLHATRLPLLIVRPLNIMDKSNVGWERLAMTAM